MTPGRLRLNTSVKRRSLSRSIRRLSNQSARSLNVTSCESSSNVKVVIRVRPFNESEKISQSRCIVHVPDRTWLVFDPVEENQDFFFQGKKQSLRDLSKRTNKNKTFAFDRVFDGDSSNEELFEETTKPIIDGLMNGFNCSVFAYGATGAGKTHTMLGSTEKPGITFLMVMELFRRIQMVEDKDCEISVSYLEVYNEMIKDLLVPTVALQMREDGVGVKVQGLSMHRPKNAEDLLQLLAHGNKNRTQHPTDANKESSRSHAVFQVYLKQKDKSTGPSENIKIGKMSLVDLAGSERATAVKSHNKARLKEGASINQSLLALGSCINALADKKKATHIPYRNSKLTRILKDSLGGNCLTVMIAAISPSSVTYDDTHNTLKYADRAKEIKLTLKRNVFSVESHVSQYKKIMEAQQREIAQLKLKIQQYEEEEPEVSTASAECQTSIAMEVEPIPFETKGAKLPLQEIVDTDNKTADLTPPSIKLNTSFVIDKAPSNTENYNELQPDFVIAMDALFVEQITIRTKILNCESDARIMIAKRQSRKYMHDQVHAMTWCADRLKRSTKKLESAMKASERKETRIKHLRKRHDLELQANQNQVKSLLNERYGDESFENRVLRQFMDCKRLEVEIAGLNVQTQHLLKILKFENDESAVNLQLSIQSLEHVKNMQLLLKEHKFLTPSLLEEYERLLSQVEGSKEVVWADEEEPIQIKTRKLEDLFGNQLLPVYRFTRESTSPWNRQSQSGLPCNPFSSTPYIPAAKAPLAAYHSLDKPGDHSYIQVDSFLVHNNLDDIDENMPSPLSPFDDATPRVPNRCRNGSPFPVNKTKSIIRSLEQTFNLDENKMNLAPHTPTLRNFDEKFTPSKFDLSIKNCTQTISAGTELFRIPDNPLREWLQPNGIANSMPASPVLESKLCGYDTPPSPVLTSNLPYNSAGTFVFNPTSSGHKPLIQKNVEMDIDSEPNEVNRTFLTLPTTVAKPLTAVDSASKPKPFAFLQPKGSATKLLRNTLRFGSTSKLVGKSSETINVQPVAPMVRSSRPNPQGVHQNRKLTSSVSMNNLNSQGSASKNKKSFDLPTTSSTSKSSTPRPTKENQQKSELGLRQSSVAISRPRFSALSKSKSSSTMPGFSTHQNNNLKRKS